MSLRERSEGFFKVFSKFLYREFTPFAVHAIVLFSIVEDTTLGNTPESFYYRIWALITSAVVGSVFTIMWIYHKVKTHVPTS